MHTPAGMMTRSPRLSDIGERGWLDFLRETLSGGAQSALTVPIGDDAAILSPPPGWDLVVTSDAMVEGTHFKKSWLGWTGLAQRAVLAAASDVTAMGGIPTGFLISLGVPGNTRICDLHAFTLALAGLAQELNLAVMGGDTVRSHHILVDVSVVGFVPPGQVLLQTGAEPGDALWVTGGLGKSRACLEQILSGSKKATGCLDDPGFLPPVRWPVLDCLRQTLPLRAMTDLSDGLALDLQKVLRAGNRGAEIHLDSVPVDSSLPAPLRGRVGKGGEHHLSRHECAFLGGEDYELLVVEKGNDQQQPVLDLKGVPLTRIGQVTGTGTGIKTFWRGKKRKVSQSPFEHFK